MTLKISWGNLREISAEARVRLLAILGREPEKHELQAEVRRMIHDR